MKLSVLVLALAGLLGDVTSQPTADLRQMTSPELYLILEKLEEIQITQRKHDGLVSTLRTDFADIRTQIDDIRLKQRRHEELLELALTSGIRNECADRDGAVHGLNTLFSSAGVFEGFCDQDTRGGRWTVIQRRINAEVLFNRSFAEYEKGFGDPTQNYWIGNKQLLALTKSRPHQLLINMEDFEEEQRFALYSNFYIDNSAGPYTLRVSGYTGNAGDAMATHNGAPFSTFDRDYDKHNLNCASLFHGGWWYNACHNANPNGQYLVGPHPDEHGEGINWYQWHGMYYSLKTVRMAMRPA